MGLENNIPEDWIVTNLREQDIEVLSGYAFKSKNFTTNKLNESYLPVLKIKNVANGDANHKDVVFHIVSKETEKYIIKKGDVLIALTGNHPFAKTQVVGGISKYRLNQKSLLNQRVAKLYSGKPNKLSDSFMYFFFKWSNTQFHIGNQSSGSASQANISKNDILNIPINLPTLSEQKAIAKVLTAFDDKIELLQAQNKTLETMAQTIFKEWFGKHQVGDELPEGWRVGKYSDIIKLSSGKGVKKTEYVDNGKYKIIGANGIIGRLNKFLIQEKVITTGRVGTLGTVFILNQPCWISDNVLINQPSIDHSFYFSYFTLKSFNFSSLNTGSTQPLITQGDLKSVEIIIPNSFILEEFENMSVPFFEKIQINNTQIQSLTKTRDTLLPKLMSGQVRVKNIKQTADA
jgi:type I restriction enzyme S subunit